MDRILRAGLLLLILIGIGEVVIVCLYANWNDIKLLNNLSKKKPALDSLGAAMLAFGGLVAAIRSFYLYIEQRRHEFLLGLWQEQIKKYKEVSSLVADLTLMPLDTSSDRISKKRIFYKNYWLS